MDFKKLAEQYKTELLDSVLPFWLEKSQDRSLVVILPALTEKAMSLTPINSFGCKVVRCGCSQCSIIK